MSLDYLKKKKSCMGNNWGLIVSLIPIFVHITKTTDLLCHNKKILKKGKDCTCTTFMIQQQDIIK